jgi:hypothetical protein
MIEAYAEEMVSLDVQGEFRRQGMKLAERAKMWQEQFTDCRPVADLGQEIRAIRKKIVPFIADPRGRVAMVAYRYQVASSPCEHVIPIA